MAPGLEVSRVLSGLWQIADMERESRVVDREAAVRAMQAYATAGFTSFDMADHYGSAEEIAGPVRGTPALRPSPDQMGAQARPLTREDVREAVDRAARLRSRGSTPSVPHLSCPTWAMPSLAGRAAGPSGTGLTNVDTAHLRIMLEGSQVSNQVSLSLDRRALGRHHPCQSAASAARLRHGGGGLLTERWLRKPGPTRSRTVGDEVRRYLPRPGRALDLAVVARWPGVTGCRWPTGLPLRPRPGGGGGVIVGAPGPTEHIADNLRVSAP
jgi:hypothetical protein